MNISGMMAGLFALMVVVGVLVMSLRNPTGTVQIFNAGADTINGVVHGLAGQKPAAG